MNRCAARVDVVTARVALGCDQPGFVPFFSSSSFFFLRSFQSALKSYLRCSR